MFSREVRMKTRIPKQRRCKSLGDPDEMPLRTPGPGNVERAAVYYFSTASDSSSVRQILIFVLRRLSDLILC